MKDDLGHAMAQAVANPTVTGHSIWDLGGQSGTGTGLCPSASVFPSLIVIPPVLHVYSFIHLFITDKYNLNN
jgi:hypothetical protein